MGDNVNDDIINTGVPAIYQYVPVLEVFIYNGSIIGIQKGKKRL